MFENFLEGFKILIDPNDIGLHQFAFVMPPIVKPSDKKLPLRYEYFLRRNEEILSVRDNLAEEDEHIEEEVHVGIQQMASLDLLKGTRKKMFCCQVVQFFFGFGFELSTDDKIAGLPQGQQSAHVEVHVGLCREVHCTRQHVGCFLVPVVQPLGLHFPIIQPLEGRNHHPRSVLDSQTPVPS
jgi:hypothetical protein